MPGCHWHTAGLIPHRKIREDQCQKSTKSASSGVNGIKNMAVVAKLSSSMKLKTSKCLGWTIIHCCLWDDKLNYAFRSRRYEMLCEKTHDGHIQWVASEIPAFP